MIPGTDRIYDALVARFVPRLLHCDDDYRAAMVLIDDLLARPDLNPSEADYLELVTKLVVDYEASHHEVYDASEIDVLRSLMEEHGLKQKDLVDVLKTESIVSEVLAGKRALNKNQIKGLAAKFSVSPAVFFPMPAAEPIGSKGSIAPTRAKPRRRGA